MEQKKIFTLDLTDCKYLGEIHERIRVAFDFPEWYGANWDAFWDLLRSECDADELKIIGINTLSKKFDEQIKLMIIMLDKFKDNCMRYNDNFDYEIIN